MATYIPTLTYCHELWVVIKSVTLWTQAVKMSLAKMVSGLSLRGRGKHSWDLV